jgi:SAM-dependent methyltransferase
MREIGLQPPVDLDYLDRQYERSPDPWHVGTGWYERRKRNLLLSSLPRERFRAAFEPGCSIGELTSMLAARCDSLIAADYHNEAVRVAGNRVARYGSVHVRRLLLPEQWPDGRFDLIVLSEIGYFFRPDAWTQVCAKVAESATEDGTIVACHWRHPFTERTQDTGELHAVLDDLLVRPLHSLLVDDDFILQVWSGDTRSMAQQEGLL